MSGGALSVIIAAHNEETTLATVLAQAKARIREMPISYSGRAYEQGKKIAWREGLAALGRLVRLNPFRPGRGAA